METHERISPDEAAEALAAARLSRARVAWSGYPWWYWITTGAGLSAATYTMWLPRWWGLAVPAVIAVILVYVAHAACRVRGVCTGWVHGPMTPRDTAILYGPATLLILGSAAGSRYASWPSIAGAVLVFLVFTGTALARGVLATRS